MNLSDVELRSSFLSDSPTKEDIDIHFFRRFHVLNSQPYHASLDRPLSFLDGLKYLDAIKVEFQDQPDVYPRFLEIMAEFKSAV